MICIKYVERDKFKVNGEILSGKELRIFSAPSISCAVSDDQTYLDILAMNLLECNGETRFVHNDIMPKGTEPDHYDFIVRSDKYDTFYLELEDVPPSESINIELMLNDIFQLTN